jgi:enamine deaminase RidA (YjgF/YER057c/UK114 family)
VTARLPDPVPQGAYLPARRHGDFVISAGMTPRRDGALMFTGPVRCDDPPERHSEAVELATDNALRAVQNLLRDGEEIALVLSLTVWIAAERGFVGHSRLADFASALLTRSLGPSGMAARAALGVMTLPGNAPVEVQLQVVVGPVRHV